MALSDTAIRSAKPGEKTRKMYDSGGLYLEVPKSGQKRWRFRYRWMGKARLLSLGTYPCVPLKKARERRDELRRLIDDGVDPSEYRRAQKAARYVAAANSFEVVGREWISSHLEKRSESHRKKVVGRLERDIFPYLGRRPISEITAPEILTVVRRVEARGVLETAHRCLQHIGQIMRYGISTGRTTVDPTQSLRGALPPTTTKHMAAPTDPEHVGQILRMLDAHQGSPVVDAAMRLLPLLFVRPGELRTMRWEDVDIESAEWRFTTSKTKTPHLVPLSHKALDILEELYPLTGHLPGGWVFTGGRSPRNPMSDAAINAAYRRLGIDTANELTGHGWRAVARTLLHEHLGYPPEVIEQQLAHAVPDALGRSYNRTRFVEHRRKMMQDWADLLDSLRDNKGKVIYGRFSRAV